MAAPFYKVNNVDIIKCIKDEGLKIEENDLDADGSGRLLDGTMRRAVVARKDKHTIECMPLTTAKANMVWQAIGSGEFVEVYTNVHPKYGTITEIMYNSARTAAIFSLDENGNAIWDNISFTLTER